MGQLARGKPRGVVVKTYGRGSPLGLLSLPFAFLMASQGMHGWQESASGDMEDDAVAMARQGYRRRGLRRVRHPRARPHLLQGELPAGRRGATSDERGTTRALGNRGEMNGDVRVLEIVGISKRYGEVVALRDLSFEVRAGELFGFVGRNGAGKTTTMRIVLGVLAADAAQARVDGTAPHVRPRRRRIGYMPEARGLCTPRCAWPSS